MPPQHSGENRELEDALKRVGGQIDRWKNSTATECGEAFIEDIKLILFESYSMQRQIATKPTDPRSVSDTVKNSKLTHEKPYVSEGKTEPEAWFCKESGCEGH
jgi:hypothetical protein